MSNVSHSLALPLSHHYRRDAREGFSFFCSGAGGGDGGAVAAVVEEYLDDLSAFLRSARLIQAHPDNYFQFLRGETWAASAVHFDHSPVEAGELAHTQTLLDATRHLLEGDDAMAKLRLLVRDGPPSSDACPAGAAASLAPLHDFYAATRRLMLGRARRPTNDAASTTLLRAAAAARRTAERHSGEGQARAQHEQDIMGLVLSHGMSPKKQHEVRIMRDTIQDLVLCCNADAGADARVHTTVNIGEGKGYVSRAVALCDGLQVVGLDCNPAHKERAVERFESLVETSLSSRDGRPRVNLLYEPRGHVASVACHVAQEVDWSSLLRGHVRTCADPRCAAPPGPAADDAGGAVDVGEDGDDAVGSGIRGAETVKLVCRVCGRVVRQECTTVVMRHIHGHLRADAGAQVDAAEVQQWNATMSQHAYVAALTARFFSVADVEERHAPNRKDAALLKRVRTDAPSSDSAATAASHLCLTRVRDVAPAQSAHSSIAVEPAYTARGYRVVLLVASATTIPRVEEEEEDKKEVAVVVDPSVATTSPTASAEQHAEARWSYAQVTATVVGYDGGADRHQVCIDHEGRKRSLRLYRLPAAAATAAREVVLGSDGGGAARLGPWRLPEPAAWGRDGVALVLAVLPPALPSTPAVYVPTVRNAVLIGLHPCGDLGSNVCRIFRNSAARGLLLVSCCWNALTPDGFPLSAALQRRGLTTSSISLLLATQPLDAWSTASPEGHRSSAKVLFFRSLFKLLWVRLAQGWGEARRSGAEGDGDSTAPGCDDCVFPAAPPHLEPAFLRRISRVKETLTFAEFANSIAAEYIYAESAKDTPYTPWNAGRHCAACRAEQEAYVRRALVEQRVAEEMAARFERHHFAPFLGLTVLRMWMCHLVESLLLLDRTLYLHEQLSSEVGRTPAERESSAVALVPLFDGALSPRMYGILARRGGSACT